MNEGLFPLAVRVVLDTGIASPSILQSRLKIKYARAAMLISQMEQEGLIGPYDGARPRRILITKEVWNEYSNNISFSPATPQLKSSPPSLNPPQSKEKTTQAAKSPQRESIRAENCFYDRAIEVICETGQASTSTLQRRLKIGYSRAARVMDDLETLGIVSKFDGSRPRKVLVTMEEALIIAHKSPVKPTIDHNKTPSVKPIDFNQIIKDEEEWRRKQRGLSQVENELYKIDHMDGFMFEDWCVELLKRNEFENVSLTSRSGDYGVDIIAQKSGLKYAIQCKCYSHKLGNEPIQEVSTGKAYYHCHVGAVMTNRYFTKGAKELASVNGILLWDRDALINMLNSEV